MNETTPVLRPAQAQPELFLSSLDGLANRLFALRVDKLLFTLVALLFLGLTAMYAWLYFHPNW
jgi:hypothetical protein